MSETIIGYINSIEVSKLKSLEVDVQKKSGFGFKFSGELNLYNYPESILLREDIVQFIISDSNESDTATILLSHLDYDPNDESESDYQKIFPSLLKDRILEITKFIKLLINNKFVKELGVSLSCCDEIEYVKYVSESSFEEIVVSDCVKDCPPNTLYIIDGLS